MSIKIEVGVARRLSACHSEHRRLQLYVGGEGVGGQPAFRYVLRELNFTTPQSQSERQPASY